MLSHEQQLERSDLLLQRSKLSKEKADHEAALTVVNSQMKSPTRLPREKLEACKAGRIKHIQAIAAINKQFADATYRLRRLEDIERGRLSVGIEVKHDAPMQFAFEGKRGSGRSCMPERPAVKLAESKHASKTDLRRVEVRFNDAALKLARWSIGDRIVCGADIASAVIAFKRDPENGWFLSGSHSQRAKSKAFAATFSEDSAVLFLVRVSESKWIPVHIQGELLLTNSLDVES